MATCRSLPCIRECRRDSKPRPVDRAPRGSAVPQMRRKAATQAAAEGDGAYRECTAEPKAKQRAIRVQQRRSPVPQPASCSPKLRANNESMVRLDSVLNSWKMVREDTAQAVEDFSAHELHYKPSADLMSFGEAARHILEAGHALTASCSTVRRTCRRQSFAK